MKNSKKKRSTYVIVIILLIITALICTVIILINHNLNKINRTDNSNINIVDPDDEYFETDNGIGDVIDPNNIHWESIASFEDDKLINILLVGQDRRNSEERQRSDCMILCSINTDNKKVSLISFMRDLYVQFPGDYSDNRLNAAYVFGGFPLLDETLNINFGINVDGNIEVDFERFVKIIDAIDGIDIELTAAEAQQVKYGAKEGLNHLNGKQALNYARIRKIDSDFNRTARQRLILEKVFLKTKDFDQKEILSLMDEILPSLTTDLTNTQILTLIVKLFPLFGSAEVNYYRIPADDAYYDASVREMSVLIPDINLIREQLQNEYLPL